MPARRPGSDTSGRFYRHFALPPGEEPFRGRPPLPEYVVGLMRMTRPRNGLPPQGTRLESVSPDLHRPTDFHPPNVRFPDLRFDHTTPRVMDEHDGGAPRRL